MIGKCVQVKVAGELWKDPPDASYKVSFPVWDCYADHFLDELGSTSEICIQVHNVIFWGENAR